MPARNPDFEGKKMKKKIKGNPPKTEGRSAPKAPDEFPVILETFRDPTGYWIGSIRQDAPSCFNGSVNIHRFRVTVERVEEPKEALAARLQDLWEVCDNHHHWQPLKNAAAKIGYELQGSAGTRRPRK